MKVEARDIIDIVGAGVRVIMGSRRVISMSKIKKIMDTRKNWILNGSRFRDCGSNPHSNGDDFSMLRRDFFDRMEFNDRKSTGTMIISGRVVIIDIIYLLFCIDPKFLLL